MYNKIILYNDEELMYLTGNLSDYNYNQDFQMRKSITGKTVPILMSRTFKGTVKEYNETETIKLDETLMKKNSKI